MVVEKMIGIAGVEALHMRDHVGIECQEPHLLGFSQGIKTSRNDVEEGVRDRDQTSKIVATDEYFG